MKPIRIQRKRTKGWKMPENTVSVCRPGKWGNPFKAVYEDILWWVKDGQGNYWDKPHATKYSATTVCIRLYESWIEGKILIKEVSLSDLKGKNIACFCKIGEPCHADVLLELANK